MSQSTPQSTPQFRLAALSESRAIAALVNSAYRGDSSKVGWTTEADLLGGQRTDAEKISELIGPEDKALLVLVDTTGEISSEPIFLGCVLLEKKSEGQAYLGMLTVNPKIQAQGIGKKLLSEAEEYARLQWACREIEMTVITLRRELIDWYVRRGYIRTGEKRPFPMNDKRFGEPKVDFLEFEVLKKTL